MEGYVYLLQSEVGFYKIGFSGDPEIRVKQLQAQIRNFPYTIRLIHKIWTDDMGRTEKDFHSFFRELRGRGEWFKLPQEWVDWFRSIRHFDRKRLEEDFEARYDMGFSITPLPADLCPKCIRFTMPVCDSCQAIWWKRAEAAKWAKKFGPYGIVLGTALKSPRADAARPSAVDTFGGLE